MTIAEIAALMEANDFEAFTLITKNGEWQGGLRRGHAVSCGGGATPEEAVANTLEVAGVSVLPADIDLFS
jgi:hypothetical protein